MIESRSKAIARSRPAWARGLKHVEIVKHKLSKFVAPRVGAWIETGLRHLGQEAAGSRPAWARGLKPEGRAKVTGTAKSRPAWARGLKLLGRFLDVRQFRRAPRGRVD